ncbi:DUF2490 domain-containing protein [Lewinella sp. IMCC34183]|uniref:DUF2490 domain-containing protein n=1 Tax=Lewinella sp. IMCC34183 TaxID=2248762 RepID=UPI0013003DDA|nr:DUF2490 domain-containing protein [Lewinella sp. IMCC34183]
MRTLLACTGLLFTAALSGQLSLFSGTSFEHEVTPRWGYNFDVEYRQVLPTGQENRFLVLLAANRLVTRGLDVTGGLRLTPYYGTDPTTLRLFTDLNYAYPIGESPWAVELRLRGQYEREFTRDDVRPEVAVRPRLGLAYRLFAHTGLVAEYEFRYRFDVRDEIVQHRYTLVLEQRISTRVNVDAFFRFEREPSGAGVAAHPYVGLYLLYVLPDRRDRDWRYRSPFGHSLLF